MNARAAQRTKFIRVMKIISLSALLPTRSIVSTCAASMESLDRSKSKDCTGFSILPRLSTGRPFFLFPTHADTHRLSFLCSSLPPLSFFLLLAFNTSFKNQLCLDSHFARNNRFICAFPTLTYIFFLFVVLPFARFLIVIIENLCDRYQKYRQVEC